MPSERKLRKKIEKYERRLDRLKRSRTRSRSRSPIITLEEHSWDTPSLAPDTDGNDPDVEIQCSEETNEIMAFQEALGLQYEEENKFQGEIQNEIATRWNHILKNGLSKEEKQDLLKKYKLPENCQLLEAPTLNEEVKTIMSESSKIRDWSIELTQHQLGLATAIVGQVMTDIIKNNFDKIILIKSLTDASKLLNDIHFQNTKTRRVLISPLLDKNFNSLVEKVKRDEHLYGMDLASKIKTSQDMKKSSSQIKKSVPKPVLVNTNTNKATGNRYGPPQHIQGQQTKRMPAPRGGPKNRATQPQSFHRPAPRQPRPERAATRGSRSRR